MADNATTTVSADTTTTTQNTDTTNATQDTTQEQTQTQTQETTLSSEAIDKIVQSKVDKITAELGKKNASLQKEIEKMKKEKMTDDEVKKYEFEQKQTALAEKEKELLDKGNRITAINELTKVELYDGSENGNTLLNMVVNGVEDESQIAENVKAIKSVIDKMVADQVDKTFKANGRTPAGSGKTSGAETKSTNIAEELGKRTAEISKQSNEILEYYYGGKK